MYLQQGAQQAYNSEIIGCHIFDFYAERKGDKEDTITIVTQPCSISKSAAQVGHWIGEHCLVMWLQIVQGLSKAGAARGMGAGEVEVEGAGTARVEATQCRLWE